MLLKVQCERCKTKYKLDDARIPAKGAKITCPKCRHVFILMKEDLLALQDQETEERDLEDQATVHMQVALKSFGEITSSGMPAAKVILGGAPPVDPGPPLPPSVVRPRTAEELSWKEVGLNTFKVKVGIGLVYDFSDITTLRKYIAEKRVAATDRVSFDGKNWHVLKDIPDLDTFFIDQWVALKQERLAEEPNKAPEGPKRPTGPVFGEPKPERAGAKAPEGPKKPTGPVFGEPKRERGEKKGPTTGRVAPVAAPTRPESASPRTAWSADAAWEDEGNGFQAPDLFGDAEAASQTPPSTDRKGVWSGGATTAPGLKRSESSPSLLSTSPSLARNSAANAYQADLARAAASARFGRFEIVTIAVLTVICGYLGWRYVSESSGMGPGEDLELLALATEVDKTIASHFPIAYAAAKGQPIAVPAPEPKANHSAASSPDPVPAPAIPAPQPAAVPETERSPSRGQARDADPPARPGGAESVPETGSPSSGNGRVAVESITAGDYFLLGQESMKMKDYEGAVQSFQSAVSMKPSDETFQYTLGLALLQAGRYPEAEESFKKTLGMARPRNEAHKWLGEIYARQGQKPQAIEAYTRYLEGAPKDAASIRKKIEDLSNS